MKRHLAIMNKSTIEAILSGRKTIETRFSKHRIVPFGEVNVGDLVYMKASGGEILGQFRIKKVISIQGLLAEDLRDLIKTFQSQIKAEESFWELKKDSSYGTLIFIGESERFLTSPIKIRKSDQRGWVVLDS